MALPKYVDALTPGDFVESPLWRIIGYEHRDRPVAEPILAPAASLYGVLIGSAIRLANGRLLYGYFCNADAADRRKAEQFLCLSVWLDDRWFDLARYFDAGHERFGPKALADALKLSVLEAFPISFDLRGAVENAPHWMAGAIEAEPRERLALKELIALTLAP